MDWNKIITDIAITEVPVLLGLLGAAATHAVRWVAAKAESAKVSNNAQAQAAWENTVQLAEADAQKTIDQTVVALNQDVVNPLKKAGQFDKQAMQDVAQTAMAQVTAILSKNTLDTLQKAKGDLTQYLQNGILTAVSAAPNKTANQTPAATPTIAATA